MQILENLFSDNYLSYDTCTFATKKQIRLKNLQFQYTSKNIKKLDNLSKLLKIFCVIQNCEQIKLQQSITFK